MIKTKAINNLFLILPEACKPKTVKTNNKKQKRYLLLPDWGELLGLLVITSQAVDSALHKNQPEFGVLILPVPLQMLSNRNCLLDQMVQILRNFRCKS
jgi:hypothetical protein